jgi:hypothetical protein
VSRLLHLVRHEWPLPRVLLVANVPPDKVIFMRLRGRTIRPFLGYCGAMLGVGPEAVAIATGEVAGGEILPFTVAGGIPAKLLRTWAAEEV